MSAVVELDGLSVRFGRRTILHELRGSFSGRCIGLLGPNGAGKTTLIHALLGFHPLSSGTARIAGRDIRTHGRALRAQLGYMPENDSFIAGMSAVRFVRMMAELTGIPPAAALERTHEALFYVGLGEARYRNLETYSLGMKQLAKLAQALVHGPSVLFLDEPTNGLDPPARKRMLKLIREIRDSAKAYVFVSSHLLRDVEEVCDEVLILKDGHIADFCNLEEERRTNRQFLDVETNGDADSFLAAARKLGCDCAPATSGRATKMVLPDEVSVKDLFRLAAAHGVEIRHLSAKRDSLEDIFLNAMERPNGGV